MKPVVSVCIPTYRYGRYVGQAIESVLSQDFSDFEIIVVDDASPDDTAKIVSEYAKRDSRILFEINSHNRGMVQNWNYCLKKASGRYIKFLFGDDFLCTDSALRIMVAALDSNPDVSMAFTARTLVDSSGGKTGITAPLGINERKMSGRRLSIYSLSGMSNLIGEPSAVIFRKEAGERGFDPRYYQLVDLEMWLHLLSKGDAFYIPEPICAFRVHSSQQTNVNVRFLQDDRLLLCREYLDDRFFMQKYLEYCQYYAIWKQAKKIAGVERDAAFSKITSRYPLWKFRMMLPAYKFFTPFYKLAAPLMYRV